MARMYCEECGETIEEECGWSTPQAGICGKCLEHRRGVTEMAKFLSATLDDDWVRITYGTTDRAPVFYLSVAEVDELHALAHGDPDGQSDNIDQMLDQRLNERREKCICPVCGDPETHANDCEIGAAEAEVERLRVENERLRAEHDDLAQWLNIFQNIALERRRQDAKWGEQNHDAFLWLAILGEEFGEAAKAAVEGRIADLRTELIHVAAVAVAAIESLNRNELVEHRATHDVFKRSAYRVLELRSL